MFKILYFKSNKHICKMYILADLKWNVKKKQDLIFIETKTI